MGRRLAVLHGLLILLLFVHIPVSAQQHHKSGHEHGEHSKKMPSSPKLRPAEGASVEIISPKEGEVFKGDEIPVHFQFVKGRTGHHIHAYVDGELVGMFESETGTLTGIPPGNHVLEARVAAEGHGIELNAADKVRFVVQPTENQR